MNSKLYILGLLIPFHLTACGDDETTNSDTNSLPTEPFIEKSNLEPPAAANVIEADEFDLDFASKYSSFLATEYEGNDDFEDAEESEVPSEVANCFKEELDKNPVVASESKIRISINADLSSCYSMLESSGEESLFQITYTTVKNQMFVEYSCPGKDFSELDGKVFSEVVGTQLEQCTEGGSFIENTTMEFVGSLTFGDLTMAINTKTFSATSTPENTACEVSISSGVYRYTNECQMIEREIETDPAEGGTVESYFRLKYNDVTWTVSQSDTWYSSGEVDVDFNNWSGQVTYNGATTAPSYSMTDGTTSATGEISYVLKEAPAETGLNLLNPGRLQIQDHMLLRAKAQQQQLHRLMLNK